MKFNEQMKFNNLPIGAVASFHSCTFVKIKNAEEYKRADMQFPNAVCLDNTHYIVMSATALCELIKEPNDYPPCDCTAFYDAER